MLQEFSMHLATTLLRCCQVESELIERNVMVGNLVAGGQFEHVGVVDVLRESVAWCGGQYLFRVDNGERSYWIL